MSVVAAQRAASGHSTTVSGAAVVSPSRLELAHLETSACRFFASGLADSTRKAYASGQARYLKFCNPFSSIPLPLSLFHIRAPPMFLCLTPSQRRSLSQNYQKLPVSSAPPTDPGGFGRPIHRYSPTTSLCLERNSTSAETASEGRQALVYYTGRIENFERCVVKMITILRRHNAMGCSLHGFLWLYASGRVYRKLRSSIRRLCSPGFTRRQHRLTCHSVCGAHSPKAIKDRPVPSRCKHLFWGRSKQEICPVAALLSYMALRGNAQGPLFLYDDGTSLSRNRLVREVQRATTEAGRDCTGFTGHSFRIGAATTAKARGLDDSTIKALGRWKSTAFESYIRIPGSSLAEFSQSLV